MAQETLGGVQVTTNLGLTLGPNEAAQINSTNHIPHGYSDVKTTEASNPFYQAPMVSALDQIIDQLKQTSSD